MIVYDGVKTDFLTSVENDTIAMEIENNIYKKCIAILLKMNFVRGRIRWNICIKC